MTTVSIVTPSFNQGAFIRATIDSVLQQDYPHLEYIVMDGGSTDETVEILKAVTDDRFRWTSAPDGGQSEAINTGLRRSKGEIVSYLNSDDLLLPGAISRTVELFQQETPPDVVYGDASVIDAQGKVLDRITAAPFDLKRALVSGQSIAQPGTFWHRRVLEKIGPFDETLHFTMDYDYWLRAAQAGCRFHYEPGLRAAFRWHEHSKSKSLQPNFLSDWERMLDKFYRSDDLPSDIRAMQPASEAFVEWGWAKTYWLKGDYDRARPLLKRFIRIEKMGRRGVALTMLTDSYLHTPFTRWLSWGYRQATGRQILFGDLRTI